MVMTRGWWSHDCFKHKKQLPWKIWKHGLGSTDWWSHGPTGYAKMFWAHRPTYNNLMNHRLLRIWL